MSTVQRRPCNGTHHTNTYIICILFYLEKSLRTHHIHITILSKNTLIKNPQKSIQLKYSHFNKNVEKSCNLDVDRATLIGTQFLII
jgi:hypothetical protein